MDSQVVSCILIVLVTLIACVILVLIFTQDTRNAQPISERSWTMPKEMKVHLSALPDIDNLTEIWHQDCLFPDAVIKGGAETLQKFQANFRDMGFESTNRGIVMTAGGFEYFTSAYLLIQELRHVGCKLPIELWYKNQELSSFEVYLLKQQGVQAINLESHITIIC